MAIKTNPHNRSSMSKPNGIVCNRWLAIIRAFTVSGFILKAKTLLIPESTTIKNHQMHKDFQGLKSLPIYRHLTAA
jgi:hypothetical protein